MAKPLSAALFLMLTTAAAGQQFRTPSTRPAADGDVPQGIAAVGTTGRFSVNFRNATIDMVLYEISSAFGFSVIKVAPMGNERVAAIINTRGLTEADAITLINIALNDLGYTAIRKGNVLQIHTRADAMVGDIPVRQFDSPQDVPQTDELMTAVIPLRSVNAAQLAQDLRPLISSNTTMSANVSANSLIVTDVSSSIRRILSIVAELESHLTRESATAVIPLEFASAPEIARIIRELYPERRQDTPAARSIAEISRDRHRAPGEAGVADASIPSIAGRDFDTILVGMSGGSRIDHGLRRFTVLHHTGVDEPHYDLLFETSETSQLVTYRLRMWPIFGDEPATRLRDHRRAYLDYVGPVPGDRGRVDRVDEGKMCVIELAAGAFELSFEDGRSFARLEPSGEEKDQWKLVYTGKIGA